MRKRTKPKVAWLPHTDTNVIIRSGDNRATNVINFILDAGGALGDVVTGVVPIVIDDKQDPTVATTSLADIEDSGYRLRRIVGKCFVSAQQIDLDDPGSFLVAGAFIVLRVDEAGSLPLATNLDQYNLFDIRNDDSPWIWRREWLLQNGDSTTLASSPFGPYPFTNAEYGSAVDGPHIDQKTARLVMADERLFFVASVLNLDSGGAQSNNFIDFVLTTRVLASMRTTLGNRRNASR